MLICGRGVLRLFITAGGGIPSSRRADMGCVNWNAALLLSPDSAFAEPEAGKLEWPPQGLGLVRIICGVLIIAGLGVCRAEGRETRMAAARTRICAYGMRPLCIAVIITQEQRFVNT